MKKVLILLGPTGVGKTDASILLAKDLDTEIISADSMQIYKGMDIGTAKPVIEERALVRHHMIDIVEPTESFSAGQYIEQIVPVIESLHKKNKMPVVVGGTGLYIKAMTRGIFSGPSANLTLREKLSASEKEERGLLYSHLLKIDPDAANKIDRNDTRRIIRALEVCMTGSSKMSHLQEKLTKPLPYEFIKIGLTRDRKELYRIIDDRMDKMIQAGLIHEVEELLRKNPDRTPLQAIGYKELALFIAKEISKEEAVRLAKRNSRRYAKRQFTWFKKEEGITWIDLTGIFNGNEICNLIKKHLQQFLIH